MLNYFYTKEDYNNKIINLILKRHKIENSNIDHKKNQNINQ